MFDCEYTKIKEPLVSLRLLNFPTKQGRASKVFCGAIFCNYKLTRQKLLKEYLHKITPKRPII